MRSVGWFAVDMSSAIAAWIYIVRIEEVEGMMGNTLDSRLGRTSPQGSLTGSAKGEGIFQSSKTMHLEKAADLAGVSYARRLKKEVTQLTC